MTAVVIRSAIIELVSLLAEFRNEPGQIERTNSIQKLGQSAKRLAEVAISELERVSKS